MGTLEWRVMSEKSHGQTITTVERAADVLNAFTEVDTPTLGVTEIAERLSLSKAVVHRILASLRTRELVDVDTETRRYSLGPAALALGLTYLQKIDVREQARPYLRKLSQLTGETATLSIRRGNRRLYIEQVTPVREVKMTVQLGHPYPLHAGSSSKAFLAHLPENEIEAVLSEDLEPLTDRTVTDPDLLRKELTTIRESGYAMSLGERQEGAGSVAAPIFDHEGKPVAVISVCGPVERFRGEVEEIAPTLLEVTAELSRQLGWRDGLSD